MALSHHHLKRLDWSCPDDPRALRGLNVVVSANHEASRLFSSWVVGMVGISIVFEAILSRRSI
jgi:hypothetical protein